VGETQQQGREQALAAALARDDWYHTLELAPGRVTRGLVDLRRSAPRVLPANLDGVRALDVGTFDGFWAFEMERRGAEVVAADLDSFLDTDWPPPTHAKLAAEYRDRTPGERFRIAHAALGSGVKRIGSSIYDLEPDRVGDPVDLAFVGALLLHLRDPVRGLEAVRSVLAPGGRVLLAEPIDPLLSILRRRRPSADFRAGRTAFDWWVANVACLREWLRLAGFGEARRVATFRVRGTERVGQWQVALEAPARPRPGAQPRST